MSVTQITAKISDQSVQLVNLPLIASGNEGVIQIVCQFDSKWSGYGKTAVFYRDRDVVYHIAMENDTVTVPSEVVAEEGRFYFGIMGSSENTRTTEVVSLDIKQGAPTVGTATPGDPTPDIYQQLLTNYGRVEHRLDQLVKAQGSGGAFHYDFMDEYFDGGIDSNGAAASINFTIDGLGLVGYGIHETDWYRFPAAFAPLGSVDIKCSTPDFEVLLIQGSAIENGGYLVKLQIRNLTSEYVEHYNAECRAFYPLASIYVPEIGDLRVDYNGTEHETAGEAVRALGAQLGDIETALAHIIEIQNNLIGGDAT